MADTSWQDLRIADGEDWSFVGDAWEENKEGVVNPPGESSIDLLAFYVGRTYSEVEAEFDFRWNKGHCGAGFVGQDLWCGLRIRTTTTWSISPAAGKLPAPSTSGPRSPRWMIVAG